MTTRMKFRSYQKARREGALERLEVQLKRGTKGEKKDIPLTNKDKARIEGEIATLKSRVR